MTEVMLKRSNIKNKKYTAIIYVGNKKVKTVHFGDKRYSDYTMHKNDARKQNYLSRHKSNEKWRNIKTAGFWSRWLLWNKKTIRSSMADIHRQFDVKFISKK